MVDRNGFRAIIRDTHNQTTKMTIFTVITLGTITTITAVIGVSKGEHFSALKELNKKEEAVGCGIVWHLCRDIGDLAVDYSRPSHHVRVERFYLCELLE